MRFTDLFPRMSSRWVHYAIAICCVAVATLCVAYANVRSAPYLIVFMAAVAVSSVFGFGPGLGALILATVTTDFFFIPPVWSLSFDRFTWIAAGNYAGALLLARLGERFLVRTGRDQKLKLALYHFFEDVPSRSTVEAPLRSHMLGRIDGAEDGEIYGWAFDRAQPLTPGRVTIYADGQLAGEILAVHYRADVGQRAFFFDLSECCEGRSKVRVEAKFSNGRLLANSPLTVEVPQTHAIRPPETILFMHIPKTGGTAFREAMAENYKQSEIAYLYPDPPGLQLGHLELLSAKQRSKFRLVTGHFQYGVHILLPQKSTYVTIVREPVERVISQYFHLMKTQPELTRRGDSLLDLTSLLEQRSTVTVDNLTVRCFSGVDEKDVPPGRVDQEIYQLAVHHLKTHFAFVGYQERSDEAYAALQAKFNWRPRPSLDIVNKSARAGKTFDEETRKVIERFNRWDCKFYAAIREVFP